jgi:hypothetical protein
MSASSKCHHPETAVDVVPTRYEEEDIVVLTVRVSCLTCKMKFAFRGLSEDPSAVAPWVSCDGFTAALPMVETHRVLS